MATQINLRCSDEQKQFWGSFAAARSLPTATWIKMTLDGKSGFSPNPRPPKISQLTEKKKVASKPKVKSLPSDELPE